MKTIEASKYNQIKYNINSNIFKAFILNALEDIIKNETTFIDEPLIRKDLSKTLL
ncbi:hypothetical protein [Clostridium sp. AWRP]|uniref:hypothetical protein n=1 Tax=Clostridium sp. AWRP TaxID=2212991 RepID=UPI001586E0E4|nr:hypothetical protein [Clostridium sp. AWRP]